MPINIYNSLTRKKEPFCPLDQARIKMYVCGPTVYDAPHIGHARSAYIFDVIRRYLAYKGYKVQFVRNVTDVDDKIIEKARTEFKGENIDAAVKKVAVKYLDAYHAALKDLGIDSDTKEIIEPKASEYIPKMIEFIETLIKRDAAYPAGGDVYFDIAKVKDYGKLSNQSPDKMETGTRVAPGEKKKGPLDFALWKQAKENEPSWDSPWGEGRPGWHIECSAMSSDILGAEFDIHGGGIDLIFPHHENELAQSEAAGYKFARYWIHHGLLTINGQKMAKSLGNFVTVKDFLDRYKEADLLKLFFLSAHHSHPVDYTDEKIREAKQALERILVLKEAIDRKLSILTVKQPKEEASSLADIRNRFMNAMDDDFNTPQALAGVFDLVNLANKNMDDAQFLCAARELLLELTGVFGLSLKTGYANLNCRVKVVRNGKTIEKPIEDVISERNDAKKRKDFSQADQIRQELETQGIILEDTKDGTIWRKKL